MNQVKECEWVVDLSHSFGECFHEISGVRKFYFYYFSPFSFFWGKTGTCFISLIIFLCLLYMYGLGLPELNLMGLGRLAAINAHCPLVRFLAEVLKCSSATACAP